MSARHGNWHWRLPTVPLALVALSAGGLAMLAMPAQSAAGAEDVGTEPPIDLRVPKDIAQAVFVPSGMAWETPVKLSVRNAVVQIPVLIPEAGEVHFVETTSSEVKVEVRPQRDGTTVIIELRPPIAPMSRQDAEKLADEQARLVTAEFLPKARKEADGKREAELRGYLASQKVRPPAERDALPAAYADARVIELARDKLFSALQQFVSEHPTWVEQLRQAAWAQAQGPALFTSYRDLLALQIAAEYVRTCGLDLDTNSRNAPLRILGKFDAIFAICGDPNADNPGSARGLDQEEAARLRAKIAVEAVVRFFPVAHPDDPNSLWLNAQSLASQARGAALIRVTGELNAQDNDDADWWTLLDYNPRDIVLSFPADQGVAHQVYYDQPKIARLRVAATSDGPVTYSFELSRRPSSSSTTSSSLSGPTVVIHESPARPHAQFPY